MAEFDPQGPSDNEAKNQAEQAEDCCGGESCRSDKSYDKSYSDRSYTDESFRSDPYRSDSFVADWSGAESKLAAQADAFEASNSEPRKPEQFWVELVQSQQVTPQATESTELARPQADGGGQSQQFWADLVRSQQPTGSDTPTFTSSSESSLTKPPTGMGWSDDEASEWAPPEREVQREYEPVQPAGEPVEAEASARRDDVEWSSPASDAQDWASARSEGMHFEPSSEPSAETASEQPSLMQAALEAARSQPAAKKAKAEKKSAAKKTAKKPAKKTAAKAKKPAKKPAAKKVVKKTPPAPKITKAPTRHAA